MERKEIVETLRSMANIYKMGGDIYGKRAQAEAVETLEAATALLDAGETFKTLSGMMYGYKLGAEIRNASKRAEVVEALEAAADILEGRQSDGYFVGETVTSELDCHGKPYVAKNYRIPFNREGSADNGQSDNQANDGRLQ